MKYLLVSLLVCLLVATDLAASCSCSGSQWCSDCGTCTVGALGATCCSENDCSGSYCCDYCTKKCTATLANCDNRTCSGSSASATTKIASSSTTKASSSSTTGGGASSGTTVTGVYITSYGWNDNDDGSGSYGNDIIAFPNVKHGHAVETSGTYADPCTFATDQRLYKPGTIIYVPHVQKYYIMEDECVECDDDYDNGRKHVDLWLGPNAVSNQEKLYDCEDRVTVDSGTIIVNPDPNRPVITTKLFINGVCNH